MYFSFQIAMKCLSAMRQDIDKNVMIDNHFLPVYVNLSYMSYLSYQINMLYSELLISN